MRSPVIGTAPTSPPTRSAPLVADRLRRLARRVVLIAAAVGAGVVGAALCQGPAAADGMHGWSADRPHRTIGGLVEPFARLTVAERPGPDRQPATGADDRHRDRPRASLAGPVGGGVKHEQPTPAKPRRLTAPSPRSVPLPRAGATAPKGAVAPLPHVVDVVGTVPIRPVVAALLRVTDAVLPPAVDGVIVPAATPALPTPPALGPTTAPVTDPTPAPAAPTPPADPVLAPVPAATLPDPAAPPTMSVVGPTRSAAPTAPLAAPGRPVDAGGVLPGQPVAPADEDAAEVGTGAKPGPGLARPLDRQAHVDAGQPCDLVPLLVRNRTLSPIPRPG